MSTKITITTYDWVPEFAHGYVRDIRVRWLCEEIGRDYDIETVPVREKSAEHYSRQPFGQVPILTDGDLSLFESGAILLYLAEGSPLLPEGQNRAIATQWLIASLNSVEPYAMKWAEAKFFTKDEALAARCEKPLRERLKQVQNGLGDREWLAGDSFSVADLMMSDVLRAPANNGLLDDLPGLASYLERSTSRPAFGRAMADHMAHWRAADERLAASE
ncbi:glutathione S-transferase family protein [Paracoccus onubensis]|uniref:Glutathione S-transferase family protein n=1 Tax=Paracoccus onubensis TaxID=1675788 RepID=A0A418SXX6_9RHOB|nr:glutathione S-transferase family protein [Paracoccus onubensis]RJE85748.1 glutathione S-transferase family protein [Paracoccus onubensis]